METGEALLWLTLAVLAVTAVGILLYACIASGPDDAKPSSSETAAVLAGAQLEAQAPPQEAQVAATWSSQGRAGPAALCKSTVWLPETVMLASRR